MPEESQAKALPTKEEFGLFTRICVQILNVISKLIFRFVWPTKICGLEHIPDKGAALIVSNHPSYLDPPLIRSLMFWNSPRTMAFMAWDKIFSIPVVGNIVRTFGAFPVNLENPGRKPYETLVNTLKAGEMAGIFPEGERSYTPVCGEFKPGATRAAHAADAPILPITIVGAAKTWPRHLIVPRLFRGLEVIIHPPVRMDDLAERGEDESVKAWLSRCDEKLRDLINAPLEQSLLEARDLARQRYESATPETEHWKWSPPHSH